MPNLAGELWGVGEQITRYLFKGIVQGGKMLYSQSKISQADTQYQRYENAMKNPTAPYALQSNIRNGVFFGTQNGLYIRKYEGQDGHVLVIGGTGSGKTSCIGGFIKHLWQ